MPRIAKKSGNAMQYASMRQCRATERVITDRSPQPTRPLQPFLSFPPPPSFHHPSSPPSPISRTLTALLHTCRLSVPHHSPRPS
jgi:hypothetical protein